MPLVTCPDCKKEISDAAPACPHCGKPNKRTASTAAADEKSGCGCASAIGWALLGLIVLIVIGTFLGEPNTNASSRSTATSTSSGASVDPVNRPASIKQQTIIWNSEENMDAGIRLLVDHVTDPQLLLPYTACFASAGDRIAILDGGFTKSKVIVIKGPTKGCTGWVVNEAVSR